MNQVSTVALALSVGSLTVLIFTLVFVVLQLRKMDDSNKLGIYKDLVGKINDLNGIALDNVELSRLLFSTAKGMSDDLTEKYLYVYMQLNLFELLFILHRSKIIDCQYWKPWRRYYKRQFSSDMYKEIIEKIYEEEEYSDEFIDLLKEITGNQKGKD